MLRLLRLLLSSHLALDSLLELLRRHSRRHALTLLHLLNEHLLLRMPQQLCASWLATSRRLLRLCLLLLCLLEVLHRLLLTGVHCLLELLHGEGPLLLLLLPLQVLHQNLLLLGRQVTHLQLPLAYLHYLLWRQLQTALMGPWLPLGHDTLLRYYDRHARWELLPLLLHLLE